MEKRLEEFEKFLLDKKQKHCGIDDFFADRLLEYETAELEDNISYEGYIEYIHTFIDTELCCIWFDIGKIKKTDAWYLEKAEEILYDGAYPDILDWLGIKQGHKFESSDEIIKLIINKLKELDNAK